MRRATGMLEGLPPSFLISGSDAFARHLSTRAPSNRRPWGTHYRSARVAKRREADTHNHGP